MDWHTIKHELHTTVFRYVWVANESATLERRLTITCTSASLNSGYSHSFGYDSAGNPTTFKGVSKTYNSKNQLTSGTSYVYDGNGNPTTYAGTTLTFDEENKATSFGTALTADYSANGLRAWKQDSSSVRTYFLYDGMTPVVELDGSGNVSATNTFGVAGLVSRRTASTGASVFYTFDERGNTVQRLNSFGTVLTNHISDAFGTTASSSSTNDPYDGYGAQSGYYTDKETGLVLCTFRYYDPANGRWLTRDPISYSGGVNLYGYVTNNPVSGVDLLGLCQPSSPQTPQGQAELAGIAKDMGQVPRPSPPRFPKNLLNKWGQKPLPKFGNAVKWGAGGGGITAAEAARRALQNLNAQTINEIRDAGITAQFAEKWAQFYRLTLDVK